MDNAYNKVAEELNLDVKAVREAYQFYWKFIRKTITSFNIKKSFNREAFDSQKTYFNLSNLGRLYVEINDKQIEYYERYVQSQRSKGSTEPCVTDSQQV